MKVRMKVDLSGTRDGLTWPPRGSIMEMPDDEARGYISAGMAEPVTEFRDAETAVVPKAEERADAEDDAVLTKSKGPSTRSTTKKSLSDSKG